MFVKIKANQIFLSGYGLLNTPKGMSFNIQGDRVHCRVYSRNNAAREYFNFYTHTSSKRIYAILKEAIQWLEDNREHVLTTHPLKKAVDGGDIPGAGLPGVSALGNGWQCYKPATKERIYSKNVNRAIFERLVDVDAFYDRYTYKGLGV